MVRAEPFVVCVCSNPYLGQLRTMSNDDLDGSPHRQMVCSAPETAP